MFANAFTAGIWIRQKTTKSVRLAALSSGLARDLEDWLKATPDGDPNGWLFPSEKLSTPIRKDGVWRRKVRPKLEEAGLGVAFHDLRHFRATQWVKQGVDLRTVQVLVGHRSIQTTMRYALRARARQPLDYRCATPRECRVGAGNKRGNNLLLTKRSIRQLVRRVRSNENA